MKLKKASGMYVKGQYQIISGDIKIARVIYLPTENPVCSYCPACIYDSGRRFRSCFLTDEPLPGFDKTIGAKCPVAWEDVE